MFVTCELTSYRKMLQKKSAFMAWDAAVLGFVALSAGKRPCPIYYRLIAYDADSARVVTGSKPKSLRSDSQPQATQRLFWFPVERVRRGV